MCLIVFDYDNHENHKLIFAANRDEFFARPTTPAAFWSDAPDLLAGRDLEAGGTWLGITRQGRFAALTNYRDPAQADRAKKSRGPLVRDFLLGADSPEVYLENLRETREAYYGYNLLFGTLNNLCYYSNHNNHAEKIAPGLYGLSNEYLNTPWPKVQKSKTALAEHLAAKVRPDPAQLIQIMRDTEKAPDAELPDTGVGLEFERLLSSLFIDTPEYGTRCTSVVLVDRAGQVHFVERTYGPDHAPGETVDLKFQLQTTERLSS